MNPFAYFFECEKKELFNRLHLNYALHIFLLEQAAHQQE